MSTVEDLAPEPSRFPRRGDKVVPAPGASDGLTGEIVQYVNERIMVKTPHHGNITRPRSWFTWKPRRKVWISWSRSVVSDVDRLERMDDSMPFAKKGVQIALGDFILIGDRSGFISSLTSKGKPTLRASGILFNVPTGYRIAMIDAKGAIVYGTVSPDDVTYDTTRQIWFADPSDVRQ